MDRRLYSTFFPPFNESRTTYHYNLPWLNLICSEKFKELYNKERLKNTLSERRKTTRDPKFYQNFEFETDRCIVLSPGQSAIDEASDFLFNKHVWEKKLAHYMPKKYKKGKSMLKKKNLLEADVLNWKIERFLRWVKCDPADGFVGDYNWLYTGGNIVGFKYYNEYWLISPDNNKESTFLSIIQLDSNFTPLWEKNAMPWKLPLMVNQPVFQISCKVNSDAVFFALRQRNLITIKKLTDSYGVRMCNFKTGNRKYDKNEFLTTSDLSQDLKCLSVVNNNCKLSVYNIESETPIFTNSESCPTKMPWTRVLFNNDGNKIYFADQQSFKIFDLRADSQTKFAYQLTTAVNKCEKICNFFATGSPENIMCMITSHNMFELDIRNGKMIRRWTHLMKHAPQFGETSHGKGKELIVLQSQDPRELVGISKEYISKEFPYPKWTPYLFSTLKRERTRAHFSGLGFHNKLSERIDFKITGLHMIQDSSGINNVFTVNGGGDVVMTKLTNRKCDGAKNSRKYKISPDSAIGLKNLEKQCYRLQTKKRVESIIAPSAMHDVSFLLPDLKNPDRKKLRRKKLRQPIWYYWPKCEVYARESLCYRKGFIADKILPHWKVKIKTYDDEDTEDEEEDNVEMLENANAKVNNWIRHGRI